MSKKMMQALAVTAEIMGNEISPAAAQVMYDDLIGFGDDAVIKALHRVRRECKGRLSLSDIIQRIDDGRPGVEEAWSQVPLSESQTVVWTEEMAQAFFVALPLIENGDIVGARMAFKEKYLMLVADARSNHVPIRWSVSLGHDRNGREGVIKEAVEKGRLTMSHAVNLVPSIQFSESEKAAALASSRTAAKGLQQPDFTIEAKI